jgi:hypothetical protein
MLSKKSQSEERDIIAVDTDALLSRVGTVGKSASTFSIVPEPKETAGLAVPKPATTRFARNVR